MNSSPLPIRSLLFVPGDKPERFARAAGSGADIYCIDLEDAVAPEAKDGARAAIAHHLDSNPEPGQATCYVRINSLATRHGIEDLLWLAGLSALPDGVLLPMVASAFEIRQLTRVLPGGADYQIMVMVETPEGIEQLGAILDASDRVSAVAFGAADYTAITGSDTSWDALLMIRSRIVSVARPRGVSCLDTPWFDIQDVEGLRREAEEVASLGFGGKLAIHPDQIESINQSFRPDENAIAWAQRVVDAFDQAGGGVCTVDGVMIDKPVADRARSILALASCRD